MYPTLISPGELAQRRSDPDWLIADCRFDLADPAAGAAAWRTGHIPGSVHADLDRDLSAPVTPATGRHPLPAIADFAATLSRWGLTAQTQVVACDGGSGMFAARLWWMMRWAGHDAVAVLDGGLAAWTAGGGTMTRSPTPPRGSTRFAARQRPWMVCDADAVGAALAGGAALVDLRAAERFEGLVEPLDAVAGHVPGARNLPYTQQLDAAGRMRPPAELAALWRGTTGGRAGADVICMCGSGVTVVGAGVTVSVTR